MTWHRWSRERQSQPSSHGRGADMEGETEGETGQDGALRFSGGEGPFLRSDGIRGDSSSKGQRRLICREETGKATWGT
jgi:hypothetical protein